MRKIFGVVILIVVLLSQACPASASSQQAYRDYQYQFDVYRERLAQYQTARSQYQQFQSIASREDTLKAVKLYIVQRNTVAKTYFQFLNEKLTEQPELRAKDLSTYRPIIVSQIQLLTQNSQSASSISSFEDAKTVSKAFETNYEHMQSFWRQIILTIELGSLDSFARRLKTIESKAQALIAAARADSSPQKHAVLSRWLLALSNKKSLYEEKAQRIRSNIPHITGDLSTQERIFNEAQTTVTAARQDLVDAASYLGEIETALTYD